MLRGVGIGTRREPMELERIGEKSRQMCFGSGMEERDTIYAPAPTSTSRMVRRGALTADKWRTSRSCQPLPRAAPQTRPCVCQFKGAEDDAMAGATEKLAERGKLQSARSGVRRGRVVETPQLRGMLPK